MGRGLAAKASLAATKPVHRFRACVSFNAAAQNSCPMQDGKDNRRAGALWSGVSRPTPSLKAPAGGNDGSARNLETGGPSLTALRLTAIARGEPHTCRPCMAHHNPAPAVFNRRDLP